MTARMGAAASLSARPMVDMLTVRGVRPANKSGSRERLIVDLKFPDVERSMPPAASRNAPTSAGRQAMLRIAMPPPLTRCSP